MNQAVVLCLLSIVTSKSQVIPNVQQTFPFQFSPFLNYLQPQVYSPQLQSFPPKQISYIVPAHTSLINSPLKTLSVFPNLYRDSRALCSLCSCKSDYGCAYNCHKCPALCYTCDCSSSLGCRYNCDKCQKIAGGDIQETTPPPIPNTGVDLVNIPAGCVGLQAESELCTWGPICQTIKNAQFPNCDYDCSTCKFSSGTNKEENNKEDDKGTSSESEGEIEDGCSILENELRLCSWGPSCQTIKDAQYPQCNYNCATCKLESSGQKEDASPPETSASTAEDFLMNEWEDFDPDDNENEVSHVDDLDVWKPPTIAAVEAEDSNDEDTDATPDECYKLENEIDLCTWGPSCQAVKDSQFPKCNYNCATCMLETTGEEEETEAEAPTANEDDLVNADEVEVEITGVITETEETLPQTPPVVVEPFANSEQDFLINLWEQFNQNQNVGTIVGDVENSFTWADFDSNEAKSCVAVSGPAAGKNCRFPFIHQGVTYNSCAILIGSDKEKSSGSTSIRWCSTKVDINRYHITGPHDDPWRNVGFCDESCINA